ncbi:DUF397 domain-containing protein [Micromonospora sp. WMMC241]|uniref:DUF397 domain-containing protein n=1 Tax=Micromonospora sp. WMMC241 TaxID=3015159 RepID=UPI0022B6FD66|nr:DUF397 domain-containing protein [Micromonospora sp. WMMC241]MCZ7440738.1 DUF397 domain-containing protein [Micromonospora sp. WMMC241]
MTSDEPCWRTSLRSTDSGGNCVEVAGNLPGVVLVRDSKDPSGPALAFTPDAWRSLVAHLHRAPLD